MKRRLLALQSILNWRYGISYCSTRRSFWYEFPLDLPFMSLHTSLVYRFVLQIFPFVSLEIPDCRANQDQNYPVALDSSKSSTLCALRVGKRPIVWPWDMSAVIGIFKPSLSSFLSLGRLLRRGRVKFCLQANRFSKKTIESTFDFQAYYKKKSVVHILFLRLSLSSL